MSPTGARGIPRDTRRPSTRQGQRDSWINGRHFCPVLTDRTSASGIDSELPISLTHQSRFLHVSLFNITSHLSHLAPVRPDRPQRLAIGHRHKILTILARNNGSRTVCAQTDTEVLSWGRTGEVITRASFQGGLENRPLPRSI